MNYDKQYVKYLIEELDKCERKLNGMSNIDNSELESLKKEKEELEKELDEANLINGKLVRQFDEANKAYEKELKDEMEKNRELHREIENIKNNMKKPVISNTINIFEEIKNGNVIKFLEPSRNRQYKSFNDNPFVFEMDGKGAIFIGELIGMYEKMPKCIKYYHNRKAKQPYSSEILYQILGATDKTFDCRVKIGTGYGKKIQSFSYIDILKMSPTINIKTSLFESDRYCKYIYTDDGGSDYIIKNHSIEYI